MSLKDGIAPGWSAIQKLALGRKVGCASIWLCVGRPLTLPKLCSPLRPLYVQVDPLRIKNLDQRLTVDSFGHHHHYADTDFYNARDVLVRKESAISGSWHRYRFQGSDELCRLPLSRWSTLATAAALPATAP